MKRRIAERGLCEFPVPGAARAARNLFVRHPDRFTHTRALLRDRASQFVNDFDEIFRTEGRKILKASASAR